MLPSLFISHGSPQLALMDNQTTTFLKNLSNKFECPKAILVISAHWLTKELRILSNKEPSLVYDFYNFPQELYNVQYEAKNDLNKVSNIVQQLTKKGIPIIEDTKKEGYDHGVWSILKHLYPQANIPILQISLPRSYSIEDLLNLGEALQPLREDTLIIGSGAMSHNLQNLAWDNIDAKPFPFSEEFRDWMVEKIEQGEIIQLKNFINMAPQVKMNHPTMEHLLPLFIALGASKTKRGVSKHNAYMYGQSMDTILFKE